MNEQDDKRDSKVEGMLRRWGASEAAGKVFAQGVPTARLEERLLFGVVPAGAIRRWAVPLAVAAAVVLVVLSVWLTWLGLRAAPGSASDIQLRDDLAKAQQENKKSWASYMESQKQLGEQTAKTVNARNMLIALQAQFDSHNKAMGEIRLTVDRLTKDLHSEKEQHKITLVALEAARKTSTVSAKIPELPAVTKPLPREVAELQEKVIRLEAKVGNFEDRLTAANNESARLQRSNDELAQQVQKAQDELAAVKQAAARDFAQAQAAYLAAAAPTERGLRARQSASRRSRMLQRVTALRRANQPQAVVPVLDRLEVVLSRLEMIDTSDSHATQSFGRLLDGGTLVGKIDLALAVGNTSAELKNVLAEAKMILSGAENVS